MIRSVRRSWQERVRSSVSSIDDSDSHVKIDNYSLYQQIGEGAYCKVRIVQSKKSRKFYALKYMPKSQESSRLRTITKERNMLSQISHPFICNLRFAFQDNLFLYMVVDLMSAGDLRHYLRHYTLSEDAIRIIIAELACALDYLHDLGIVHRDVKPENILMDNNGHVHLGDFNVATQLSCENPVVKGVSGTFSYLAPEMQNGSAYTELVDWWALGVVFYECVYGRTPFKVQDHNQRHMLKLMARGAEYPVTGEGVSRACVEAMKRFLVLYPYERIKDCNTMFKLEFFAPLTKEALESCTIEPVFIPPEDRFDFKNKLDRTETLMADLKSWQKKRNSRKHGRKFDSGSRADGGPKPSKYRRKIKRYSLAVNRYFNRSLGHQSDSDKRTEPIKFRFDFQTYNHEYIEDNNPGALTAEKLAHRLRNIEYFENKRGSISPLSVANKRDSLLLPHSIKHPSRIKRSSFVRIKSSIRKAKSPPPVIPDGVVAFGQAGRAARVPVF